MTVHQDLLSKLRAIDKRQGTDAERSRFDISGGPRVFDVKCWEAGHRVWHWVGTADQIADALNKRIDQTAMLRDEMSTTL